MSFVPPPVTFDQEETGVAEVERVIVTGSNIPTAEEVGLNPVGTYRPPDIEKLGGRNATDFLTNFPQEMGANINHKIVKGGDGSVIARGGWHMARCERFIVVVRLKTEMSRLRST